MTRRVDVVFSVAHPFTMKLTAAFIPAPEGGFTALIEEIPGAIAEGETIEEARENLADALKLLLECNRELAREEEGSGAVRESLELAAV
jgi:predicted RNase H-like HicB family nuclease